MPRLNLVLAPLVALAVSTATLPLCASARAAAPSREEKKALDEASELYKQGKIKFEMAEYTAAIDLWKEAYAKLPEGDESRAIKNDLVYNISEAQVRAYEIDRDPTHLRKARVLLADYLRNHEALYGTEDEAVQERAAAKERLDEVDRMLESAPEGGAAGGPGPDGAGPDAGAGDQGKPAKKADEPRQLSPEEAAKQARLEEINADPELRKQDQAARKRIVTGAVLGGIGITLAAGGYFALSYWSTSRTPTVDPLTGLDVDGEPATGALVTGIVLGVAGLGLLGAGAGLFGTGMKSRKQLRTPSTAQATVSPWVGRGSGGATVLVRF